LPSKHSRPFNDFINYKNMRIKIYLFLNKKFQTGIILVIAIHPGNPAHYPGQQNIKNQPIISMADTLMDLIR